MPLIIDGNNLLHSLPRGQRSREEVRRQVLEAVRQQRARVTVVFDGPPPSGAPELEHLGRVTVRYSGSAVADSVILDLLPASDAAEWVVVSDDRQLRERARQRGASVRTLGEWKGRRAKRSQRVSREPKLSSHEIAEWEDYFTEGRGGGDS
jgi:hypothetical protein